MIYKNIIFLLVVLLTSISVLGQELKSFSQDFTYEENGQEYQGSFRYSFSARTDRMTIDLLANPFVNFKRKGKQVWIRIYKLRLDKNSSQDIKLFVQDDWLIYNNKVQPYRSGREALVELDKRERFLSLGGDPKTIGFNVLEDGVIKIQMGYSAGKTLGNTPRSYLNFLFTVEGTGKKPTRVNKRPSTTPITTVDITQQPTSPIKKPVETEPLPKPDPKPLPPQKKELTAEEKAWEAAVKVGTILSYQQFINTYPNHAFVAKAKVAIETLKAQSPIEINIHQRDDVFVLLFHNAKNPRIVKIEPDDKIFSSATGDSIEIQIKEEKIYTITIEDDLGKVQTVEIDNNNHVLPLSGKIKAENGSLVYEAKGGFPPYSLIFRDGNDITVNRVHLEGESGKIPFKKLGNALNGVYTIDLLDKRKTMSKTFKEITIQQQKEKKQFWLFIGLGIGIIALFSVLWYYYRKIHRNEFEEDF